MQHACHADPARLRYHGTGVVLRVPRMHHDGQRVARGQLELRGECCLLHVARRIVVVIVKPALANGDGTLCNQGVQCRDVVIPVERRGIVRVNSRSKSDEAGMLSRDPGRIPALLDAGANADYRCGASISRATYYRVAVTGEGLVREVGVAVDEACHTGAPTLRGYLCSIQRSTGPAM